jgi:hypothetical protein
VIQTLAANRANHPFHVSSLSRRGRSRKHFLDSHGFHILTKLAAENAVPVAQQISRDLIKGEGLAQLLGSPFGAGVGGYVEMDDAPPVVSQHQKHVRHLEAEKSTETMVLT